jgi:hypothetical protein
VPAHWPADYRRLVERRIAGVEKDRNVGLIGRPEYKRRWSQEPWEARRLADHAGGDTDLMQLAELYRGHPDFDVHALVAQLVESEAMPFLPALRYKPTGLRTPEVWEHAWDLQCREDAIDAEVEAEFQGRVGQA